MAKPISQIGVGIGRAKNNLDEATKVLLNGVSQRIIEATPVLSGLAKGNWQASINQMPSRPLDLLDPDGSVVTGRAARVVELAPGNVYYFVNMVHYIKKLEYEGWSRKSPHGMVRLSIKEVEAVAGSLIAQV